jgi:hypothetical protein
MSRHLSNRRGDAVVNLVVALVVVFVLALAFGYAAGWIKVYSTQDNSTVEFETKEMKDAAQRTADQAGRGLNKLGEETEKTFRDAGKAIHDATDDDDTSGPRDSEAVPMPLPPVVPQPILPTPILPTTPDPTPAQPAPTDIAPGPPVAPEIIPDSPRR